MAKEEKMTRKGILQTLICDEPDSVLV